MLNLALLDVLKEQIERNKKNISFYEKKLQDLPKGSLHSKIINGHEYYYIKYRNEQGKRIDEYVNKERLEEVRNQLFKRKEIEKIIKELKDDIRIAEKGLK